MIKRLTDDPMPLRQALPTANFPAGLQQVMDHALARYANDRYSDAVEFAKDVEASLVGIAPEGGATMVVGAADMKTMVAGPPPKTRIAGAAEKGAPARQSGAAAPEPKKSPVMAIAAGVVILAAAGGGYAVFGRGKAPVVPPVTPADTQATVRHDTLPSATTPTTTPATNPVSNPGTRSNPGTTPTNPGTRTNPPAGTPKHDQAAIQHELDASVDVIAGDNPSARRTTMRRLTEIYGYTDLPDDMRADAARQLASGYSSVADEGKQASDVSAERSALNTAIDFYQKADRLAPSDRIKSLITLAQARVRELGNP
jgi:hypothetical protein